MITTNDFCKKEYGTKLYKISFDAGFSCPNRDGKLDSSGCIFCSEGGSGDFAVKLYCENLSKGNRLENSIYNIENNYSYIEDQISKAKDKIASKYKGNKYIAYFQAFSNTYANADILRKIYIPIINRSDISVLSIATRPDCISEDTLALLKELNSIKPVWVELGLQTTKQESVELIRRGYDTYMYDKTINQLNKIGIHTITHVILFLPGESIEDMSSTVQHAIECGTEGIKLQLLHILEGTELYNLYLANKFHIPSMEEYVDTLEKCVKLIPENIVIHRLTGDPPKKILVEPKWSADKKRVINTINKVLRK